MDISITNLLCEFLESYVAEKNATYQYIATELTLLIKKSMNSDCIEEKQNEVEMLASMHILTEYALQIYNDLIERSKQFYTYVQDYTETYMSLSKFLSIVRIFDDTENCTDNSTDVRNEHTFDEHTFDSERSEMESPNFEPDKDYSEHSETTEKQSEEPGVSNFEVIKTMSPQELAAFLFDISENCNSLYTCGASSCFMCPLFTTKTCNYVGILEWLNEDYENKHSSLFAWIRNFHRNSERSERGEKNESEDAD